MNTAADNTSGDRTRVPPAFGPAALCRLDASVVSALRGGQYAGRLAASCMATLVIGSAIFGAAFGGWRSGGQALLSAVKMPLLMLSVTAFTGVINTLLAQVLGARLSFRQTLAAMLLAFAVASALLAALAPVSAFFAWQAPAPGMRGDMTAYRALLVANTAAVGAAGIAGNVLLYRLLVAVVAQGLPPVAARPLARRVLLAWILSAGLAGCELSWVLSPYLARPDLPVPVLNPNAFRRNFFEYLFHTAAGNIERSREERP